MTELASRRPVSRDIDYVLIGPAGVFTVNAKNHAHASVWGGGDTFIVNGQRVPCARNSRHEAGRASRLLTEHAGVLVDVVGVIAVVGAHRGGSARTCKGCQRASTRARSR